MHGLKKLLAITLLAVVASVGAPAALAEGNAESPTLKLSASVNTNVETSGADDGNAESPTLMFMLTTYLRILI